LRPAAACSHCGHLPAHDQVLLSTGMSSPADPGISQPQAAVTTGPQQQQETLRREAAISLQQARQLLQV